MLYTPGKDVVMIEEKLSTDMQAIATWCMENELILNLKKGKTESMLFGTSKRLSSITKTLEIKYVQNYINVTTSYNILGLKLTRHWAWVNTSIAPIRKLLVAYFYYPNWDINWTLFMLLLSLTQWSYLSLLTVACCRYMSQECNKVG